MTTLSKITSVSLFALLLASGCSHAAGDTQAAAPAEAKDSAKVVAAAAPAAAAPAAAAADKPNSFPHAVDDAPGCEGKGKHEEADSDDDSVNAPRVQVALDRAPTLGARDAKVTIVAFSDFQCPFCAKTTPILEELEAKYRGKVRIAYKQSPLPFHENAKLAAKASLAAGEQGKFWEYHDVLAKHSHELERANLEVYARDLGLDARRFAADLDGTRLDARVAEDLAQSKALGVRGTPTVFVNGRRIIGAQGRDVFTKVVEEELSAASP